MEKAAVPFRNDTNGAIKGNTNCVCYNPYIYKFKYLITNIVVVVVGS